jgi:hypothetical protein
MLTRYQKKLQQSTVQQSTVQQSAVQSSFVQNLEEETCAICCDALHQTQTQTQTQTQIKTLHSGPHWKHRFHDNCIDEWYLACIENKKTPCCPLCPGTEFPDDYVPSLSNKQYAIKMFKSITSCPVIAPYIGIMVCMNGNWLFKMTNLNLYGSHDDLEYNMPYYHEFTLWRIKDQILNMNKTIYDKFGDPNETWTNTLSYLFNSEYKYPKLKIINTCYTIPPKCVSFGEMDMSAIDDSSTLRDIYIDYHTQLEKMKNDPFTDSKTLEHIDNISTETSWVSEDHRYITGYSNPENPNVIRSGYFPWAWIAIHLEYKYEKPK